MNKLISIVVPIYNVESYLEKCIESIRSQTYRNIQIILVDDGSTDSSGTICEHFRSLDSRIMVIHQENRGLVAARKAGLEVCSGEYIGFVDGDDYIDDEMYCRLIAYIEETKADIVHSGYFKNADNVIWGTAESLTYELSVDNLDKILQMLIAPINPDKLISASIWSKLYKREVILKAYRKVPNKQSYGEDILSFCNALTQSQKVAIMNEAFYHYVYRENSITQVMENNFLVREYSLYQQLLDIFKDNQRHRKYIELMLARNISFALKKMSDGKICCYEYPDMEEFMNKRIVIYGAGMVGQDFYRQFSAYKNCNIVAWVDKLYTKYRLKNSDVYSTESLFLLKYDVIVIAVSNRNLAEEITNMLLQIGVNKNKIVWKSPRYVIGG